MPRPAGNGRARRTSPSRSPQRGRLQRHFTNCVSSSRPRVQGLNTCNAVNVIGYLLKRLGSQLHAIMLYAPLLRTRLPEGRPNIRLMKPFASTGRDNDDLGMRFLERYPPSASESILLVIDLDSVTLTFWKVRGIIKDTNIGCFRHGVKK